MHAAGDLLTRMAKAKVEVETIYYIAAFSACEERRVATRSTSTGDSRYHASRRTNHPGGNNGVMPSPSTSITKLSNATTISN